MPITQVVEAMPIESPAAFQVFHLSAPVLVPAGGIMKVPIFVFGLNAPLVKLTVSLHARLDGGALSLTLGSPDGTLTFLSAVDANGGLTLGESRARPLVFDDDAERSIGESQAPFAGPHRPEQPLAAYRAPDRQVNGVWHLLLSGSGAGRARTLVADAALVFRS